MKWGAVGHGWFVVVAMALPGCRFEDRTPGGARRDDTSVQALADGFYAALALRAVTSVYGMTADYYPFTHDFLGETATRIINEVPGINRVFYDCTSKPPGTIDLE